MRAVGITKGHSDAAQYIDSTCQSMGQHFHQSVAFSKQTAYDELATVWRECNVENWDGSDAFPILAETFETAYLLIQALPLACPLPSVGAEPDGHLTLEWYRHPRWTLSVSVSPDGVLYYAALFGESYAKGSEVFLSEVPKTILNLIERVMLNA